MQLPLPLVQPLRWQANAAYRGTTNGFTTCIFGEKRHAAGRVGSRSGEAAVKTTVLDKQAAEMKDAVLAALARAGDILDAKAPTDASAFKYWLLQISQHVAEAAGEGGFLGFDGVRVSDAEKATWQTC